MALKLKKYRKYAPGGDINTPVKGDAAGKINGQVGFWGQVSQIGEQAGTSYKGDKTDVNKNRVGDLLTPTHTNVINAAQAGDGWGVVDSAFFGGLFGTQARRESELALKQRKQQQEATNNYYTGLGNQRLANTDLLGNQTEDTIYEDGGELGKPKPKKMTLTEWKSGTVKRDYNSNPLTIEEWKGFTQEVKDRNNSRALDNVFTTPKKKLALGGKLNKLNSNTVEVEGQTHEEGGVKLPSVGAEVEDKETIAGNYVFSDELGFASKHKKIAKQIGKIEKKPTNRETISSLNLLRKKEHNLKQQQEHLKADLDIPTDPAEDEMGMGGKLRKYAYGGGGDNQYLTSDDNYPIFDNNTISNTGTNLNTKKRGNGMRIANSIAPYLSNISNSLRELPKPINPVLESSVNANLVNYGADRNALDQSLRGINVGVDNSTSNTNIARANKVANLSKFLAAKGELTQQENNTNAGIINQNRQFNQGVNARNVERQNEYNNELVNRQLTQQNLNSENLADASTKFQQQQRDNSLMQLENRKLDILPGLYKDTGVLDRSYRKNLEDEHYRSGGTIHINPANKGKFNALKARTGKSTEELTHSSNALTRKRAQFALNASKWSHKAFGGELESGGGETNPTNQPQFKTEQEHIAYYRNKALESFNTEDIETYKSQLKQRGQKAADAIIALRGGLPAFVPPTKQPFVAANPTDWHNLGFNPKGGKGYRYGARGGEGLPAKGSITRRAFGGILVEGKIKPVRSVVKYLM